MAEKRQIVNGWSFPSDLDVPSELGEAWHRFKIADKEIKSLSRARHVDLLHQRDVDRIGVEVVHAGFDGGILHVGAKAVIEIGGERYTALQGADSASNQVNEPGYTYAVAETRALKRAAKKALNIYPADEDTATHAEEEVDAGGSSPPRSDPPTGGPPPEPDPDEDPTPSTDPTEEEDDDKVW